MGQLPTYLKLRSKKARRADGEHLMTWVRKAVKMYDRAKKEKINFYVDNTLITKLDDIPSYPTWEKEQSDPRILAHREKVKISNAKWKIKREQRKLEREEALEKKRKQLEFEKKIAEEAVIDKIEEGNEEINNTPIEIENPFANRTNLTFEERRQMEIDLVLGNIEAYRMVFRYSFLHFLSFFFRVVYMREFTIKPHHLKIAKALENRVLTAEKLKKPNLYIGLPPRFGKSQLTKLFSAWCFFINPQSNIIYTSFDERLAQLASEEVRNICKDPVFLALVGVDLSSSSNSKEYWQNSMGGGFRAASMRSGITGFGAGNLEDKFGGFLGIDDYMKPIDASSKNVKSEVVNVYTDTLKSRRNNKSGKYQTPIICIAQRLAKDDLIGWIMQNEPDEWEFLIVPALGEDGKSTWEEQISTKELLEMKEKNPFLFYSQYQQDPIIQGGNIVKEDWFNFYKIGSEPAFQKIFMVADTAYTAKSENDPSAVILVGITNNKRLYVLDLLHVRLEVADLEKRIIEFWNKHNNRKYGLRPSCIYLEKRSSGEVLAQNFRRKGLPMKTYKYQINKYQRLLEVGELISEGHVYLPEGKFNEISQKVIKEATEFTSDDSHEHDDIFDTLMAALDHGLRHKKGFF